MMLSSSFWCCVLSGAPVGLGFESMAVGVLTLTHRVVQREFAA